MKFAMRNHPMKCPNMQLVENLLDVILLMRVLAKPQNQIECKFLGDVLKFYGLEEDKMDSSKLR